MSATIFQIEDGVFALSLVDPLAVGYLPTWNHPDGSAASAAVEADYEAGSVTWKCQVTSAALTASPNANDVEVPATFCDAAQTIPQPGQTSFTLDAEFLQDPTIATGLSQFLFENDTEEAYFLLGLNGDAAPKAVGKVRLVAGSFGGPARTNLTATVSLPCSQKPDIAWGTAAAALMTVIVSSAEQAPPAKSKQKATAGAG